MCENDYINEIRNEIRSYMVLRGQTYKTVAEKLTKRFGEPVSAQALNNKLARGSLRYVDAKNIAEVLGISKDRVSIKAGTNEKMDSVGEGRSIECDAVVLVIKE